MTKLFLDKNCKVDATDVSGKTPLHLAASYGHVACVEMLGKASPIHVNDQDERGLTALHIAAKMGNRYVYNSKMVFDQLISIHLPILSIYFLVIPLSCI